MKLSTRNKIIAALSSGYILGILCSPIFPSANHAYAAVQRSLHDIQQENISKALDIPEEDVEKTRIYKSILKETFPNVPTVYTPPTPMDRLKEHKAPILKIQPQQTLDPPEPKENDKYAYTIPVIKSDATKTVKYIQNTKEKTINESIPDLGIDINPENIDNTHIKSTMSVLDDKENNNNYESHISLTPAPTAKYVMNPGPSPETDIQDAKNAQSDAQMVFSYEENQLYKIYCKVGYITDLKFQEGEKIIWMGGGDTAKWSVQESKGPNSEHIYIKPISKKTTTNIIINTNKHSYNILCESSEVYNPMVKWNYAIEEQNVLNKYNSNRIDINNNDLNFDYKIQGDAAWKPTAVFNDGKKTYIKFNNLKDNLPIMMIKEKGKKNWQVVNYKLKNDTFIVDGNFQQAQLKLNKEVVKIVAEN